MSLLQRVVIACALAVPIGLLGASAFNPDSGFILHSTVLWRIFGIMFEIGLPLLLALAVCTAIVSAINSRRSRRIY